MAGNTRDFAVLSYIHMSKETDPVVSKPVKKKRRTQQGGTWIILFFLIVAAIAMAFYNAAVTRRDISIATGPHNNAQLRFFIEGADRPDMATLYKSMTPKQRIVVAENIGTHNHPKLAKLIGVLLADFDPNARKVLTTSLSIIAQKQPKAVAEELKHAESFQNLGVSTALKTLGTRAIPYVIEQLSVGDARPQAKAFLVECGSVAAPPLLECLKSKDKDVRLAAVETLGKLRYKDATLPLLAQYNIAETADKLAYLTALASIGDSRSETVLSTALNDPELDASMKQQAALGLGRIASDTSVKRLWSLIPNPDLDLVDSTIDALRLAGDVSLEQSGISLDLRIQVAGGIDSELANTVILQGIQSSDFLLTRKALLYSAGRSALANPIASFLQKASPSTDGRLIDAAVDALATTGSGRQALKTLKNNPVLAGFIDRCESAQE
jgi:HEAT repeat protein